MFEFIKKLLKREKDEPTELVLSIEKVPEWLQKEIGQVKLDISPDIKNLISDFDEHMLIVRNNTVQLEKAELRNKNIPIKEVQIMEGNRKAFIASTLNFIQSIKHDDDIDFDKAKEFADRFNSKLEEYNNATLRNYHILQNFFSNEVDLIVREIKTLHNIMQQLESLLNKNDISALKKVKNILDTIDSLNEKRGRMSTLYIEKEEQLKEMDASINKQKNKMSSIENSFSFKKFKDLISEREEAEDKIKVYADILVQNFSKLDTALRKYQRLSLNQALIGKYLNDPVDALTHDEEMLISDELQKLNEQVDNLALKDEKTKKTREIIKKLDKAFLLKYKHEYEEIRKRKMRVVHQINIDTTMLQYDDATYKLKYLEKKKEIIEKELKVLEEKLKTITEENLIKELENNLMILTGKETKIHTNSQPTKISEKTKTQQEDNSSNSEKDSEKRILDGEEPFQDDDKQELDQEKSQSLK